MVVFTKQTKDVAALFSISFLFTTYSTWALYLFYVHSYAKLSSFDLKITEVFNLSYFLFFGTFLNTLCLPTILFFLGFKLSLLFGIILFVLHLQFSILFSNLFIMAISFTLGGFTYKHTLTLCTIYFKEKYSENAEKLYGFTNSAPAVSSVFLTLIYTYIINPNNDPIDGVYIKGDYREVYYTYDYIRKFAWVLNTQSIICIIMAILIIPVLENPDKHYCRLGKLWSWLRVSEKSLSQEISMYNESINKSKTNNLLEQSFSTMKSKSGRIENKEKEIELLTEKSKNDIENINKNDGFDFWKELTSKRFILLFVSAVIRLTQACYLGATIKMFAAICLNDDKILTLAFSLSSVTTALGIMVLAIIIQKYGLFNSHLILEGISVFADLIYIFVIKSYPSVFVLLIFVGRLLSTLHYQLNNFTIFSLYNVDVALKLNKIYELSILVGNICFVFFNNMFYSFGVFYKIFGFYLILNVSDMLMVHFVIKGRWKDN